MENLWTDAPAPPNATIKDDGATLLKLAGGNQFRIHAPPKAITGASVPRALVRDAVSLLNDVAVKTHSARTNPNLSDQGRRNELAQTHSLAALTAGQLWKSVQGFKKSIADREQTLFAITPPDLNRAGAAIRAWECRSYFASLSPEQKSEFLASVGANSGQAAEMVSALLTGPYAVASKEMADLQEAWQAARRAQNPTEAEAIDADRDAAEWAESTIATVTVPLKEMMASVGTPDPIAAFAQVKTDPADLGFEAFGIKASDMTRAKQQVAMSEPVAA